VPYPRTHRRRMASACRLAGFLVLVTVFAPLASAEAPRSQDDRLAAILTRAADKRIATERGVIRIVGFGTAKARQGAIFFIHGDPDWHRSGAYSETLRAEETRVLADHLDWMQRTAAKGRHAVYFVARTGMFGSDGETTEFRSEDSYLSIGRAIDKVIEADGITAAAIVGHSGGAAVALYHAIALARREARCYALASGVYNIGAMAEFMRLQKRPDADVATIDATKIAATAFMPIPPSLVSKLKYFEPLFRIRDIPKSDDRQIAAISDRRDRIAPFFASADLVARLKAAGHRAVLVEAAARGPSYHYTYDAAIGAAVSCLAGGRQ
jgi:pimeloyl-ACP methyl ester carboxylesterase